MTTFVGFIPFLKRKPINQATLSGMKVILYSYTLKPNTPYSFSFKTCVDQTSLPKISLVIKSWVFSLGEPRIRSSAELIKKSI